MDSTPAHTTGSSDDPRDGRSSAVPPAPLAALLVLILTLAVGPGAAPALGQEEAPRSFDEAVRQVMERQEFEHSTFGLALYSLERGEYVYRHNSEELFTPASTTKLITEGAALGVLGGDHRFTTRVYRTGSVDSAGVLRGDLVLVGSGDPNLSNRVRGDSLAFRDHDHAYDGSPETMPVPGDPLQVIRDLARQVAQSGIRRVSGRVRVDVSLFREGREEQGSSLVLSPLVINDNVVDVWAVPGDSVGAAVRLRPSPATSYVELVNRTETGPEGTERSIEWKRDARRPDGSRRVVVEGTMPVDGDSILYAYNIPEPSRFGEIVFAESLQDAGVTALPAPAGDVDGDSLAGDHGEEHVVAEHVSPPLSEEIKVTLKVSQNLHADLMPYLLGVSGEADTVPPYQAGFDRIADFLGNAGLETSGASQGDGAGGDRADFFTPAFMTRYLAYMSTREDFGVFRRALPVLGRDGTLARIQTESPAAGHVRAKTGTYLVRDRLHRRWMLTSKALAGYVTTRDGRRLAFAFFLNRMPSDLEPGEAADVAGRALGELATAAYRLPVRAGED